MALDARGRRGLSGGGRDHHGVLTAAPRHRRLKSSPHPLTCPTPRGPPRPTARRPAMSLSPLSALSPLDGRYASRMNGLRPLMSELALMHRRVQVEVEWFIALSDAGFAEFAPLCEASRGYLRGLVHRFGEADGSAIKDIERTTNHDVKAVEYWLKQRFRGHADLEAAAEFVHFACTSEDINNTSHALMLKAAREQVLLPALERVIGQLRTMALAHAEVPMLSRTHGQTASPTTVGKEIANVVARLEAARARIAAVPLLAKMNGAVGNYNAHLAAYPDFDWEAFSRDVVEQRLRPELQRLHDPDRTARLHGRAVRRRCPRRHHPDRLGARRLGLHLAGLLQAAPEGRRGRFPRPCRTRSTRSTSKTPRATSAWPTRCWRT
ncbi:MAG: lyase family protein [Kouleothrix sp.]